MAEVHGEFDRGFEALRDAFAAQLDSGEEVGASIVVNVDGTNVVDIWGGAADPATGRAWERDTIVNVWSTTKTVTNLAALICADRGLLDVHAPVATYWPEFAANGKEAVEVRHLLSHTSGVSGLDQPATLEDLYDRDLMAKRLADQAPWWEPGTASGYHAITQGHLVGEVVRRVSGKTLTEFVRDEIAGPLGADFQIGAAESDWSRIAPVIPPPPIQFDLATIDPASIAVRTFTGPRVTGEDANTAGWRLAEIGAANGHGNARSVARMLSAVSLGGTVDGVRLLRPETLELIFEEQSNGVDLVLGVPVRFGIGYALPDAVSMPHFPQGSACYWGGWGGSLILMDLDRRTTIAYMMNKMGAGILGSARGELYTRTIYSCLG